VIVDVVKKPEAKRYAIGSTVLDGVFRVVACGTQGDPENEDLLAVAT